jgi:hypothetical protein
MSKRIHNKHKTALTFTQEYKDMQKEKEETYDKKYQTEYYEKRTKEKRKEPEGKEKLRNSQLRNTYGITLQDYNNMYDSQNGNCLICETKFNVLVVDHNHKTGKVRGLLCRNCNTALGFLKDNILFFKNAIKYLERL